MIAWLLDRLKERSTWVGIIGIITAAGVNISPEQTELIVTAGVAIVGAIMAFTADVTK